MGRRLCWSGNDFGGREVALRGPGCTEDEKQEHSWGNVVCSTLSSFKAKDFGLLSWRKKEIHLPPPWDPGTDDVVETIPPSLF